MDIYLKIITAFIIRPFFKLADFLRRLRITLNEMGYEGDLYDIGCWIISFRIYPIFLFSFFSDLGIEFSDFFDSSLSVAVFAFFLVIQIIFFFSVNNVFFFQHVILYELLFFFFFFPISSNNIFTYVQNNVFEMITFDPFSFALVGLTLLLFFNIFFFIDFSRFIFPKFKFLLLFVSKVVLVATFTLSNIFHFYVFFETILLPFFFLISIWGSRLSRIWSAQRLIFFTLFFSTPMLIFILTFVGFTPLQASFNFFDFYYFLTYYEQSALISIFFFFSFSFFLGVKIPLFPMHIWLPEAHGEAPTIGSILLAGLLLKLGAYGFYRFLFFMPGLSAYDDVFFFLYFLALFSILASNFSIFSQLDFKKIIAYFSIGHIAYVVIGFCVSSPLSVVGAFIITISHGLSSAVLFFLVGFLYDQTHTRSLNAYSGLASKIPYFSFYFFLACLANISFPGTAGFVGEQLIFVSLSFFSPVFLIFPIFFTIFTGFATILFILRLLFGNTTSSSKHFTFFDFTRNDTFFVSILIAPLFFFGFIPSAFLLF